jgi:hypothetical protein
VCASACCRKNLASSHPMPQRMDDKIQSTSLVAGLTSILRTTMTRCTTFRSIYPIHMPLCSINHALLDSHQPLLRSHVPTNDSVRCASVSKPTPLSLHPYSQYTILFLDGPCLTHKHSPIHVPFVLTHIPLLHPQPWLTDALQPPQSPAFPH